MANRTRQRIRRRNIQSIEGRFPGDDGAMSDMVSRLFGNDPSLSCSLQQVSSRDEFPEDQIKATVAAIVGSSRPKPPSPSDPEANAMEHSPSLASSEAVPNGAQASAEAGLTPFSQTSGSVAAQQGPKSALTNRIGDQNRTRIWFVGLAAAAGVSVSALALMLGLQSRTSYGAQDSETLMPHSNVATTDGAVFVDQSGSVGPSPVSSSGIALSGQVHSAEGEPGGLATAKETVRGRPQPTHIANTETIEFAAVAPPEPAVARRRAFIPPPSLKRAPNAQRLADLAHTSMTPKTQGAPSAPVQPTNLPPAGPKATAAPAETPRFTVPMHEHKGPIVPGSAASVFLEIIEASGEGIAPAKQRVLASRIERALETELNGRTIHLETPSGQLADITFGSSRHTDQNIVITRSEAVALPETGLTVEGGWFAARDAIEVRPLPDLRTEMDDGQAALGTVFQRIATVTSVYGDRWYLIGQNGVAEGYVSAAEVTPADTFNGPLGHAFGGGIAQPVHDLVRATTLCRTFSIALEETGSKSTSACRNAYGGWQAPKLPATSEVIPIVSDQEMADVILEDLEGTADPLTRARLTEELHGLIQRGNDRGEFEIPVDGDVISVVLGDRVEERRAVNLRRTVEMAPVRSDFTIGHGWVEARLDTQLRPMPSTRVRQLQGTLSAGQLMEVMGVVGDPESARWAVLGRNGVAQGYAEISDFRLREPRPDFKFSAMQRPHGRVIQGTVTSRTVCQTVTTRRVSEKACERPDGVWAIGGPQPRKRPASVDVAFSP